MAVALLLYVVAEVAAVWAVSSAIGFFPTIGLLLAGAFLGSALARRQGAKAAKAFVETARSGKSAHAEVTDGMLIALGGLLILLPGFVSDVAGLLFLLPPSRSLIRRSWLRRLERRAPMMNPQHPQHPQQAGPGQPRVIVVDSEIVEDDRSSRPTQQPRPIIDPQ
ncbi:FxsA family protein [Amycolatopsis palatopharyngis]|uniref:FxsA family protein n=1 Tax=Amycolatopsis palatopharyngis TaxID=187982 RepID=UPI000E23AB36|nr:FxsA family protein [Amycolatopsis palatopharyngis]